MLLDLSFKKIVQFILKVVIWALKAKKWPCPPLPIKHKNTVKTLGKNLSFSSSLVNTGQHQKKLTYLGYYRTVSVPYDGRAEMCLWGVYLSLFEKLQTDSWKMSKIVRKLKTSTASQMHFGYTIMG